MNGFEKVNNLQEALQLYKDDKLYHSDDGIMMIESSHIGKPCLTKSDLTNIENNVQNGKYYKQILRKNFLLFLNHRNNTGYLNVSIKYNHEIYDMYTLDLKRGKMTSWITTAKDSADVYLQWLESDYILDNSVPYYFNGHQIRLVKNALDEVILLIGQYSIINITKNHFYGSVPKRIGLRLHPITNEVLL